MTAEPGEGGPEAGGAEAAASLGRGLRLALAFFTVAPVQVRGVDRAAARVAMLVAPIVGAGLGAAAALVSMVGTAAQWPPLLSAVAAVAILAALTRGLHLDGLADLADGLGSGKPAEEAVAIMRRSDIGPFGVVVLLLTLQAQVAAVAGLLAVGTALPGLVLACSAGRAAATLACRAGVRSAGPGLGALVAGTVPRAAALALAGTLALLGVALGLATAIPVPLALAAVAAALGTAAALERRARARLGGVTGDVFGALIETATTTALLVLAVGAAR